MDKVRVLHLITSLNMGGTEKYVLNLTKALKERFSFHVGYIKEEGPIAEALREEGINVIRINNFFSLYRFLEHNDIQILHTHLYRANIMGRLIGKISRVPVIISSQRSIDAWKRWHHVMIDKWTMHFADYIIANSEATKDLLTRREKVSASKIEVIYNGVDTAAYVPSVSGEVVRERLGISQDIPVIGYVGRLHPEKGVDFIPRIASELRKTIPQFKVLVIGDGPFKQRLKHAISKESLSEHIVLLGTKDDILSFIDVMDVVILPSREESFSQAALESMKMEKPVIASDVGGMGELIDSGKNGILMHPGRPIAFAQAILSLLENRPMAEKIGEAARKKVTENFDIKEMIEKTENIYMKLIKKKLKWRK
ncbi:MAG: glycosyltransferase [bacterium]